MVVSTCLETEITTGIFHSQWESGNGGGRGDSVVLSCHGEDSHYHGGRDSCREGDVQVRSWVCPRWRGKGGEMNLCVFRGGNL